MDPAQEGSLQGCRARRTKRLCSISPGQRLRRDGAAGRGRSTAQIKGVPPGGVSAKKKYSERIIFKHLTGDLKAILNQGQQIRTLLLFFPFLSSHPLIPKGSEAQSSKLGKRSREQREISHQKSGLDYLGLDKLNSIEIGFAN